MEEGGGENTIFICISSNKYVYVFFWSMFIIMHQENYLVVCTLFAALQ